jgi:hypothetical protein
MPFFYLVTLLMHDLQKRWPQAVCTASLMTFRQIGQTYLASTATSDASSTS